MYSAFTAGGALNRLQAAIPLLHHPYIDYFNHVEFREELLTSTPKHSSHPELLGQLALAVINDVPDQALIIYTHGSHSDTGRAGSGIFSNTPGNDVKISIRNSDHCSVFRSKLIAISGALDHALISYKGGLVRGNKYVSSGFPPFWGVPGNEVVDELAGRGYDLPNISSIVLTHSKIPSFQRSKMNLTWRNPPAHHWCAAKSTDLFIQRRSFRAHQTALARFRSGYLHSMTFVQGVKSFFTCPCSLLASPAHLLDSWGISLRQLYEEQDLVCDTITRKDQMDLV
ncbi:RNA-directed DNA polymerase from mobile element jockey [Trichonephila clavipes]|uniref:RNA-directed DNA polymerase from mobile element jockey n=1 Tax=Trichonephila clavipes TaxID=2585209 RepID=A0A8X6W9G3_TRICX|nr:RNA-directed DNA polymerase from mobile element jockey [Trichonephila clavipes]